MATRIKHVYGNVLRLAIPLTKRTVSIVDGNADYTDTDFVPSNNYPIKVQFGTKYTREARMRDSNIACVEDRGELPVGVYAVTVLCKDSNGNPMRFKQNCVVQVVDVTAAAGITPGVEFQSEEHLLDAAIFLAVSGQDGVGIENYTVQETAESGGLNVLTLYLTDGRTISMQVRNGRDTDVMLEFVRDPNYIHTDNNYTNSDREKVQLVDMILENAIGNVVYNQNTKRLNFYALSGSQRNTLLAYIDVTPFLKDSMVTNFYISNGQLVLTFNADAGNRVFTIPLSAIFNQNNYYTRAQVDNKIAQIEVDTSGLAQLDTTTNRVKYSQNASNILGFIEDIGTPGEEGPGVLFARSNGHIYMVNEMEQYIDLGYAGNMVFYDKNTESWYRYENSEWVMSGGSSGGYNVSFDNGNVIFSGSTQPTFDNGNIIF